MLKKLTLLTVFSLILLINPVIGGACTDDTDADPDVCTFVMVGTPIDWYEVSNYSPASQSMRFRYAFNGTGTPYIDTAYCYNLEDHDYTGGYIVNRNGSYTRLEPMLWSTTDCSGGGSYQTSRGWYISPGVYVAPPTFLVRFVNTDIFTNVTINPSNINISYVADGVPVWYNETIDGDISLTEPAWIEKNILVCSDAPGYPQICLNNYIPNVSSIIIWQKLVPFISPFPTPTSIGNVSTNITSQNLTEPLVLPKFTLINKSLFRDQITNNSIIGNYTYGITSFMDEIGDAVNQTVQDSIEFIDVPFDFLIDIQAAAHNLYLALFIPFIPFTYLPLLVTTKVVAVIPWQIQSLISMGLLVDLFYLMIRGSGGS